ncbi:hypothetical protein ABZ208_35505 [Streptomyces sp. NPDC006208]|uniref:hypothetical protein n=1 Tax=Streptomyces sp. NPDC006208 TaxID=3156734 RepID=UPI00339EF9D4
MSTSERLKAMVRTDRGSVTVWSPDEVRDALDAHRAEARAEILGDELNPSSLALDAEAYRYLVDAIERTMTDPNRWDGDDDAGTILARYVEWLAAERAKVRAEVLLEVADELESINFHPKATARCGSLCRQLAGRFRRSAEATQ